MKEKEKNLEEVELNTKIYEVGYLLAPTLSEEEVPTIVGNLKELVSSLKGEFISEEMPKMIPLAYTMLKVVQNVRSKFDDAYFGWVKFEMDSVGILELKKKLDLDPNIIRFLILKTVRENTLAQKRFPTKEGGIKRKTFTAKKEGEEEVAPIDEKEIDEEIEKMVSA
ncbi:MAG: 30S ribosomal protein S6 [Candidatus Paceibacterota bacterium]